MREIQKLLERYAKLQAPEKTVKKAFVEAIQQVVGVSIDIDSVRIRNKTARLDVPAALKHEIRLNQQKVIEATKDTVGKDAPIAIY